MKDLAKSFHYKAIISNETNGIQNPVWNVTTYISGSQPRLFFHQKGRMVRRLTLTIILNHVRCLSPERVKIDWDFVSGQVFIWILLSSLHFRNEDCCLLSLTYQCFCLRSRQQKGEAVSSSYTCFGQKMYSLPPINCPSLSLQETSGGSLTHSGFVLLSWEWRWKGENGP